jgi:dTDP-4-dehydrorhamnose 3,5-epimerase-like enzyme
MASAFYTPDAARGARYDDPAFAIQWPLPATLVSEPDRNWPLAAADEARLAYAPTFSDQPSAA